MSSIFGFGSSPGLDQFEDLHRSTSSEDRVPLSARGKNMAKRAGKLLGPLFVVSAAAPFVPTVIDFASDQFTKYRNGETDSPPSIEVVLEDTSDSETITSEVEPLPLVFVEPEVDEGHYATLLSEAICEEPILRFDTYGFVTGSCIDSDFLEDYGYSIYPQEIADDISDSIESVWPSESGIGFLTVDQSGCRLVADIRGGWSWADSSDVPGDICETLIATSFD